MMNRNKCYIGDSREVIDSFPDNSIHCIVTSPPYFGLRSYLKNDDPNKAKEIGLENTPEEYVNNLVSLFAKFRRVLHSQGTVWLNLGDSYNGSGKAGVNQANHVSFGRKLAKRKRYGKPVKLKNLKPKDLIGVPWMVAFALRNDGWYLRSDIIWEKPNPMPESVTDRPTKSHEYIFLLSKSQKYWYDKTAIEEKCAEDTKERYKYKFGGKKNITLLTENQNHIKPIGHREYSEFKNKRSVWKVYSQSYPDAHYAVFPPKLIEPCILAGCPEFTCSKCGNGWIRDIEIIGKIKAGHSRGINASHIKERNDNSPEAFFKKHTKTRKWIPNCNCNAEAEPGIVLDPFFGSGTTGIVANKYGRDYIGIDLNEENKAIIKRRKISKGLFSMSDLQIKEK